MHLVSQRFSQKWRISVLPCSHKNAIAHISLFSKSIPDKYVSGRKSGEASFFFCFGHLSVTILSLL